MLAHRIVVTGAGGQIGRFLAAEALRRGYWVNAFDHQHLDITDTASLERYINRNDVVFNCAGFSNVDASEARPVVAHAVNALGPRNLARTCAKVGADLVHISTNYIFSGDRGFCSAHLRPYEISDAPSPVNVYGRTKLSGELAIRAELPTAHIVRTSWVYTGGSGGDFVATMRRLATTNQTVDVVADQIGCPTYVKDLVDALLEIAEYDIGAPILHAVNSGTATSFDQARAIFAMLGADQTRIRPIKMAGVPRAARRPAYSALSMRESVRFGLTPLRPWQEALAEALSKISIG